MRARAKAAAAAAAVLTSVLLGAGTAEASPAPTITAVIASQPAHVTGVNFTPSGSVLLEIDPTPSGQLVAFTWVTAAGPHWVCTSSPFPLCHPDPGGEITWDYAFPPQFCYTLVIVRAYDLASRTFSNVTPPASTQCVS